MIPNSYRIQALNNFLPGLFGLGVLDLTLVGVAATGYYLSAPVVMEYPSILAAKLPIQISFYSTDSSNSNEIKFLIDFFIAPDDPAFDPYGSDFIKEYNQNLSDADLFNKPSGYSSGEVATFNLPMDSDVLNYERVVFRVQAFAPSSSSNFSEYYELYMSELIPHEPEFISSDSSDLIMFRWISASDLPELEHQLNYKLEVYDYGVSAMSMLSAMSVFSGMSLMSHLSGINSFSYQSAFSMLSQMGFLNLLYSSDWIAGQISYTYGQVMSMLSNGSYFARVGVYDSAFSSLFWSMLEPFEVVADSRTLVFQPGLNLYAIPVLDLDANTARRLLEIKFGYKYTGEPWASEITRWKELSDESDKWGSIAASRTIIDQLGHSVVYQMTTDFDIEGYSGYFINLNSDVSRAINFKGSKWV